MPRKTTTTQASDTITITREQFAKAGADAIDHILSDVKSDSNAPADAGMMLMMTSLMIVPAIMHELFGKPAEE